MDERGRAHLRFGDGELGYRPAAGTAFVSTLRLGNGPAGNVGAESIHHMVFRGIKRDERVERIRNPLPARGGTAPESLEQVRLFAPYAFRSHLQRAISAEDYATIVMRDYESEVQRAAATQRWTGSWYEILVAVDLLDGVSPAILAEIEQHLARYRRMGHDLVVRAARTVPLDIMLVVCVKRNYVGGHVKLALLDLFSNRRLPDGRLGFFHPDNLTFGEGISLSKLVALAQSVTGVENVIVERLQRWGERPAGEVAQGLLPLGPFEVARLDNDPSVPENGLIEFQMKEVG
jgi:predicted phage baseplate assembly protein